MVDRRELIADEGWLFAGVLTLFLAALASLTGIDTVAAAIGIVGWFFICPVLLFWGEQVADAIVGPEQDESETLDPVEELKRRYARGEIDEEEFERKLNVLLETETDRVPELE